ncbi:hypothetical protein C8F01DRAFT_753949 [Mycena amicta]|nr:hypothetical protein C8F01DRAFT_753949 [Mycena amicta]
MCVCVLVLVFRAVLRNPLGCRLGVAASPGRSCAMPRLEEEGGVRRGGGGGRKKGKGARKGKERLTERKWKDKTRRTAHSTPPRSRRSGRSCSRRRCAAGWTALWGF